MVLTCAIELEFTTLAALATQKLVTTLSQADCTDSKFRSALESAAKHVYENTNASDPNAIDIRRVFSHFIATNFEALQQYEMHKLLLRNRDLAFDVSSKVLQWLTIAEHSKQRLIRDKAALAQQVIYLQGEIREGDKKVRNLERDKQELGEKVASLEKDSTALSGRADKVRALRESIHTQYTSLQPRWDPEFLFDLN